MVPPRLRNPLRLGSLQCNRVDGGVACTARPQLTSNQTNTFCGESPRGSEHDGSDHTPWILLRGSGPRRTGMSSPYSSYRNVGPEGPSLGRIPQGFEENPYALVRLVEAPTLGSDPQYTGRASAGKRASPPQPHLEHGKVGQVVQSLLQFGKELVRDLSQKLERDVVVLRVDPPDGVLVQAAAGDRGVDKVTLRFW